MARKSSGEAPPPLLTVTVPVGQPETVPLAELAEDTRGASNHLLGSMRCAGQLEPIKLERLPDGSFRVRAGNRRTATARKLGWSEIRALMYEGLSEDEWALVLAGEHNRAPNPVEEARLYRRLSRTLTEAGIHANTGVPVQEIRARMVLLNLPDDVLGAVGTKGLALGVAEEAARLKGVHLDRAVRGIRAKLALDQAFTKKDLKEVTVARRQSLGGLLATLSVPAPTLIPQAEVLALEVRELCARRGVDVGDLARELQAPAGVPVPEPAQLARVN